MSREEDSTRPYKKQRVGVQAPSSTQAMFAFGSRLPDGKSLLKGPKSTGKNKVYNSTDMRAQINPRKRRRPVSRDEDEATSRTKPSHRLKVKTGLPLHGSHLPAPTKVSSLLSGSHLHTISPSNPAIRHTKSRSAEQELIADLAATDPEFWVKRRERVENALKELDMIEKRIIAIIR